LADVSKGLVGTSIPQAILLQEHKLVERDKANVSMVTRSAIHALMREAAEVCGMTYMSNLVDAHMPCVTSKNIRRAWMDDSGTMNQKRLAWMYFYYPTVIYNMVLNQTHQEVVEEEVLSTLGVSYSNASDLNWNQRSCVQQVYGRMFAEIRSNIMRGGRERPNQKLVTVTNPNSHKKKKLREKTSFFIVYPTEGRFEEVRMEEENSVYCIETNKCLDS
jgi:hypothetical protein